MDNFISGNATGAHTVLYVIGSLLPLGRLHWEVDMLITILPVIGSLLPLSSPHPVGGLSLGPKLIWTPTWPISIPSRSYYHSPLAKKKNWIWSVYHLDPIITVHWLKRKTEPDQHYHVEPMWSWSLDHAALKKYLHKNMYHDLPTWSTYHVEPMITLHWSKRKLEKH
jgi:hypothetical protein